jgi:hypothetical protein
MYSLHSIYRINGFYLEDKAMRGGGTAMAGDVLVGGITGAGVNASQGQ